MEDITWIDNGCGFEDLVAELVSQLSDFVDLLKNPPHAAVPVLFLAASEGRGMRQVKIAYEDSFDIEPPQSGQVWT